jgi:glycosyltransferase involved in cell wall biosynthesis
VRVLHVHSGNLFGGIETMLVTQVRQRQLCPGLETSFALCFEGRLSEELTAAGATVHRLSPVRVRNLLSVRRARQGLAALLRREAFDVVVMHSCWALGLFGQVARANSLPLVFYMHSPATGKHWLERWARRVSPDLVLCNSNFTAATSVQLFPQVKTETVYCPVAAPAAVDVDKVRSEVRAELQTPPGATVIIQVSRMEALKGHALQLEALSTLKDIPGWVCWQVGGAQRPSEARYLDQLKETAAKFGIAERVQFLGPRSDVSRLLCAADLYCQPNIAADSFGIAFVEALYARLPVITTALGGAAEIVDKTCGVLVPSGDVDALAESLRGLISSRPLRERLGIAGPNRALSLCEPSRQLNQFHNSLRNVLTSDRH